MKRIIFIIIYLVMGNFCSAVSIRSKILDIENGNTNIVFKVYDLPKENTAKIGVAGELNTTKDSFKFKIDTFEIKGSDLTNGLYRHTLEGEYPTDIIKVKSYIEDVGPQFTPQVNVSKDVYVDLKKVYATSIEVDIWSQDSDDVVEVGVECKSYSPQNDNRDWWIRKTEYHGRKETFYLDKDLFPDTHYICHTFVNKKKIFGIKKTYWGDNIDFRTLKPEAYIEDVSYITRDSFQVYTSFWNYDFYKIRPKTRILYRKKGGIKWLQSDSAILSTSRYPVFKIEGLEESTRYEIRPALNVLNDLSKSIVYEIIKTDKGKILMDGINIPYRIVKTAGKDGSGGIGDVSKKIPTVKIQRPEIYGDNIHLKAGINTRGVSYYYWFKIIDGNDVYCTGFRSEKNVYSQSFGYDINMYKETVMTDCKGNSKKFKFRANREYKIYAIAKNKYGNQDGHKRYVEYQYKVDSLEIRTGQSIVTKYKNSEYLVLNGFIEYTHNPYYYWWVLENNGNRYCTKGTFQTISNTLVSKNLSFYDKGKKQLFYCDENNIPTNKVYYNSLIKPNTDYKVTFYARNLTGNNINGEEKEFRWNVDRVSNIYLTTKYDKDSIRLGGYFDSDTQILNAYFRIYDPKTKAKYVTKKVSMNEDSFSYNKFSASGDIFEVWRGMNHRPEWYFLKPNHKYRISVCVENIEGRVCSEWEDLPTGNFVYQYSNHLNKDMDYEYDQCGSIWSDKIHGLCNNGCAKCTLALMLRYWYENDPVFKVYWNQMYIRKNIQNDIKIPGKDIKTPNPYNVIEWAKKYSKEEKGFELFNKVQLKEKLKEMKLELVDVDEKDIAEVYNKYTKYGYPVSLMCVSGARGWDTSKCANSKLTTKQHYVVFTGWGNNILYFRDSGGDDIKHSHTSKDELQKCLCIKNDSILERPFVLIPSHVLKYIK